MTMHRNEEYADMHLAYGAACGNSAEAKRICLERLPGRYCDISEIARLLKLFTVVLERQKKTFSQIVEESSWLRTRESSRVFG
ncbi:hypothetical protein J6590_046027 [Homalodisca vitripennis]|nr:hypothetical protein J6590_046027 [Homalodisca vitripennis]